tara:strand:- start:155 stop:637 length:483 start_codon:yes stop_codon:yes gene_type:complete
MKIYKITSPNCDLVYVGKTTKTLKRRLQKHHSGAKMYMEGKRTSVCSSIKVLEHGDAVIELIEETDDHRREAHWIKELNGCNQVKMNLVDKSDPVSVAKYNREYNKANRERLLEYHRGCSEYRNETVGCDHCGRMVSRRNMARHKKLELCINNPLQINSL